MKRGWAAAAALAALAAGVPALAQTAPPAAPVLHDAPAIRACLCLEAAVQRDGAVLEERRAAYDEKRRAAEQLDAEAAAEKPRVNVSDPAAVAAFKALLDRRDAAQTELTADALPAYRQVVEGYNAEVDGFNRDCAGRSYDMIVLDEVRADLACPPAKP